MSSIRSAKQSGQFLLCRRLHVSRDVQFKQPSASADTEAVYRGCNKFKWGTPNRAAGIIKNFRKTSAHSTDMKNAPKIPEGAQGGIPYSKESMTFGRVYQYPVKAAKTLAKLGSFVRGEGHELFKEHCTLLRDSTSQKMLETVKESVNSESKDTRICLLGDSGVGKSTTVAQAHAFAAENGYVILHLRRAEDLIDGNTDALFSQKHKLFIQSMLARRWMNEIYHANKEVLSQIKPSDRVMESSGTYQPHSPLAMRSLYNFLKEGKKRKDAFNVLEDFMVEISEQNIAPVLFSMDNINILTHRVYSDNKDTSNRNIKALDLQLVRHFFDFYSGRRTFKRGFVLAATTGKAPVSATIKIGLGMGEAPNYVPKSEYDEELSERFKGVEPLEVSRLTQSETNALLEFYHEAELIHTEMTDSLRSEMYFLSGNGNPRSLLRTCSFPSAWTGM